MNYIHNFFIYCAGSNFSLIRKSPSEISKHVGIGGVIFFTGLLAALSSGYAFYTIFDSKIFATIFGVIWGLMIFNLDRFIVASMRKSGGFFRQFLMSLPRILLAGVLGIVISKPLELKIFEKEINKQLNVIINRNKAKLQKEIKSRYDEQGQYYNTKAKLPRLIRSYTTQTRLLTISRCAVERIPIEAPQQREGSNEGRGEGGKGRRNME